MASRALAISSLTEKGQTTIPAPIRKELKLVPGDRIEFEMSDGRVFLRRVEPFDYLYHQGLSSTLSEWDSTEDNEAYSDL